MGGQVKINDDVRDESARFRKLIAYIPQDEELRMALTAKESMMFAANLKLGYTVSTEYKTQQVRAFPHISIIIKIGEFKFFNLFYW